MLVNVVRMHVVQMTVMRIVDMALVANRRMPAVGAVVVGMVGMVLLGTGGHRVSSFVFCYMQ